MFVLCMFVNRNLRKTESRKNKLENQLNSVGAKVNELKEKYIPVLPFVLPLVLYFIYGHRYFSSVLTLVFIKIL